MNMRCELCGLTNHALRMGLCRVGEIDNGQLVFRQREVCPKCVSRHAVLMPTATMRDMTEAALSRTHEAVCRALIHKEISNAGTEK
jgi:hypothetical protein